MDAVHHFAWPDSAYRHVRSDRDPQGMGAVFGGSITLNWLRAITASVGRGDWQLAIEQLEDFAARSIPSRQRQAVLAFGDVHLGIANPQTRVEVFQAVTTVARACDDGLLEHRLERAARLAEVTDDEWIAAAVRMERIS